MAMIHQEKMMQHVRAHPFPLMFATISGAHLYGFPSPDSDFDLRGVQDLIQQKLEGPEKGTLSSTVQLQLRTIVRPSNLEFHHNEYTRLTTELEQAYADSTLPMAPTARDSLNDLLVRLRLAPVSS